MKLAEYTVVWKIPVVAGSFRNAAERAAEIWRDGEVEFLAFEVRNDETGRTKEILVDIVDCAAQEDSDG